MSCNYNCLPTPERENDIEECGANGRLSGANAFYLLECDHGITDPSSQAQIDAAVVAEKAKLIENVRFGFDEPSPIPATRSHTSCGTIPVVNYTRSATVSDYLVTKINSILWNVVKKRNYGGLIVLVCSTSGLADVGFFVDSENLQATEFLNFPDSNDEEMFYSVKFNWKDPDDPEMVDYPS